MTNSVERVIMDGMRPADCHPEKQHYSRGFCSRCYVRWYRSEHPDKRYSYPNLTRRYRVGMRSAVVDALGGRCVWCGFSDERGLEIDHIIPIRKQSKDRKPNVMYRQIMLGERDNLQLLCGTCHRFKTNGFTLSDRLASL